MEKKKKKSTTKITLLRKISFNIDGEIKNFTGKQKLREFSTTKTPLQQIIKGFM